MIRTETRVVLVDAVVTDKKGNYVADLGRKDFKVLEDGKEQVLKSFSFEADPSSPLAGQKHYLVLFFDNSHMDAGGQMRARQAAGKFIDANAGPNRLMAVVNYGGTLEIAQNFTTDADRLKQVVSGVRFSVGPSFGNYGNRNSLLALNTLAKNLADVPGRKILVLLTGGFAATGELLPDITAAIAMCNKSNVAIYPIDVGGLATGMPDITQPGPWRPRRRWRPRADGIQPLRREPLRFPRCHGGCLSRRPAAGRIQRRRGPGSGSGPGRRLQERRGNRRRYAGKSGRQPAHKSRWRHRPCARLGHRNRFHWPRQHRKRRRRDGISTIP